MKKRSPRKSSLKRMQQDEDVIDKRLLKDEDRLIRKVEKYLHLHMDNYETSHGRRIEGTLFLLNMLAVVLFMVDTFNPTGTAKTIFFISELSLVSVFVVEYIARLWVAQHKLRHAISMYSIIDLLSILPVLVSFVNLTFFRIFRILRLFRLLRVLRFQRMFKAKNTLFGNLSDTQIVVVRIVLTVFTIIFVSSGLIWAIENKVNPGAFGNIFNALYFSVVTLSTVGYGDITPLSPWGKLVTVGMILSGIALIPWQLGKLVKIVVLSSGKTKRKCTKCGLLDHDLDAKFCKQCGKKVPVKISKVI
ncbi:TPA: ion transporter [Candidatus Woesearchaeota archaeon]|nr:ion transporter [Candidatus Woesearchaeota archaeon]